MFSKSLFGNKSIKNKSIINPIDDTRGLSYENEIKITNEEYEILDDYNETYLNNLINEEYDKLPNDLEKYVEIMNLISNLEFKTKNLNTQLLLKIIRDGLIGTMNVFGLNSNNVQLNIKNVLLQNRLNNVLSAKNEKNLIVHSEENYNLKKTFTLIPLYHYYISLFGIPEEGTSFDLKKIELIKTILQTNNMDPYNII
jgi:hypothetical protein